MRGAGSGSREPTQPECPLCADPSGSALVSTSASDKLLWARRGRVPIGCIVIEGCEVAPLGSTVGFACPYAHGTPSDILTSVWKCWCGVSCAERMCMAAAKFSA